MRCFEGELDSQESVKHLSMIDARLGQSPPLPLPLRRCFPPDYGLGRNTPAPQPKCWWTSRLARPSVTCVCVTQTLVCLRHDENTKTIQRVNILLRHESPPPPTAPPSPGVLIGLGCLVHCPLLWRLLAQSRKRPIIHCGPLVGVGSAACVGLIAFLSYCAVLGPESGRSVIRTSRGGREEKPRSPT